MRSRVAVVFASLGWLVACAGSGEGNDDDGPGRGGSGGAVTAGGGAGGAASGGASGNGGSVAGRGGAGVGGSAGSGGAAGGGGASGGQGGSGASSANCSAHRAAWKTSEEWAFRVYDGGKVWIRNNTWGKANPGYGTQAVWADSPQCWGADATHLNGTGMVKGYPQNVRGWATGDGFKTEAHGLGTRVDALKKATLHWKMETPRTGRFMALWDIFFHDKAKPAGSEKAQTSLMLFQRIQDDGYYKSKVAGLPNVELGGQRWKLEVTTAFWATGKGLVLYLDPTSDVTMGKDELTVDLKAVIDGLVAMGHISATKDHLTSIQNGWEIIAGGAFKTVGYAVDVE